MAGGREGSFAGWLRLGRTIGDNLLLGWEGSGWLKHDSGPLQTSESVTRVLGNSAVIAVF